MKRNKIFLFIHPGRSKHVLTTFTRKDNVIIETAVERYVDCNGNNHCFVQPTFNCIHKKNKFNPVVENCGHDF